MRTSAVPGAPTLAAPTAGATTPLISWSVAKSFTHAALGIAYGASQFAETGVFDGLAATFGGTGGGGWTPKNAEEAPNPSMVCLTSDQFTVTSCDFDEQATRLAGIVRASARGQSVLMIESS